MRRMACDPTSHRNATPTMSSDVVSSAHTACWGKGEVQAAETRVKVRRGFSPTSHRSATPTMRSDVACSAHTACGMAWKRGGWPQRLHRHRGAAPAASSGRVVGSGAYAACRVAWGHGRTPRAGPTSLSACSVPAGSGSERLHTHARPDLSQTRAHLQRASGLALPPQLPPLHSHVQRAPQAAAWEVVLLLRSHLRGCRASWERSIRAGDEHASQGTSQARHPGLTTFPRSHLFLTSYAHT